MRADVQSSRIGNSEILLNSKRLFDWVADKAALWPCFHPFDPESTGPTGILSLGLPSLLFSPFFLSQLGGHPNGGPSFLTEG